MKHIVRISKGAPVSADQLQRFICQKNQILFDILDAMGAQTPILGYIANKCDLPQPNTETGGTTPTTTPAP